MKQARKNKYRIEIEELKKKFYRYMRDLNSLKSMVKKKYGNSKRIKHEITSINILHGTSNVSEMLE